MFVIGYGHSHAAEIEIKAKLNRRIEMNLRIRKKKFTNIGRCFHMEENQMKRTKTHREREKKIGKKRSKHTI